LQLTSFLFAKSVTQASLDMTFLKKIIPKGNEEPIKGNLQLAKEITASGRKPECLKEVSSADIDFLQQH
jgi:hypothetical protein